MPGRRAFPYSVEAEEQAAPLPGRRKAKWRNRPRRFNTLDAAGTFAARRAAANGRRQHVRPEQTPFGLMFFVRERDVVMTPIDLELNRRLVASLNRMEREA
ncbi:hypothetical protein [Aeromicrobium sp. 9AM]|uniref:hypothetical protein n=1 Tax=Aeromicrobium sp. 9AM TaxID=2653126 RepID=UPI0012F2BF2A|nr:hypothetical protein [Aeromicrobium sp. 9AM]VXC20898.1 hypothetical protein AERO9AM_50365 [Aeromicrobium sp. 9AM]